MMKAITLIIIFCHTITSAFNPGYVSYSTANRNLSSKQNHFRLLKNEERSHRRHLSLSKLNNVGNEESESENRNSSQEPFEANRPIFLPSLENAPDAGPLYNTCRSVTGVEQENFIDTPQSKDQREEQSDTSDDENISFLPNKPIQLESLKGQDIDHSFFGIQPRAKDESEVPLLMDTGLGVFTNSLILGGSIYFLLVAFMDADIF